MKLYKLFFVLCLVGCKTVETPTTQNYVYHVTPIVYSVHFDTTEIKLPVMDYVVKKIIKEKNDLYIIDLERSDTVFRIFSHYDGEKNANDVKIHINDSVRVVLIEPSEMERNTLWDNPFVYGEADMEIYGVFISKYLRDPNYFKVRFCDDLNGPYIRSKEE